MTGTGRQRWQLQVVVKHETVACGLEDEATTSRARLYNDELLVVKGEQGRLVTHAATPHALAYSEGTICWRLLFRSQHLQA